MRMLDDLFNMFFCADTETIAKTSLILAVIALIVGSLALIVGLS